MDVLDKPNVKGPRCWGHEIVYFQFLIKNVQYLFTLGNKQAVKFGLPQFLLDFPKGDNNRWQYEKSKEVKCAERIQRTLALQLKEIMNMNNNYGYRNDLLDGVHQGICDDGRNVTGCALADY